MRADALRERMARSFDAHFDPTWGSRFWLERAAALGLDPRRDIRSLEALHLLGDLTQRDLVGRPLLDFVPRRFHRAARDLVVAQTGGATGASAWTAYTPAEFRAAFVEPFVAAAEHLAFPRREAWVFAAPTGPHIIGRAADEIAAAMDSPPPFKVDFDPRWARTLERGSFAARRYLAHVVEQAADAIRTQHARVLFATPPVVESLAETLSDAERREIRAVHYGGMALDRAVLARLQGEAFPEALHLSGYGNTLMGCCLELNVEHGRAPAYFAHGDRLHVDLRPQPDDDADGRVCLSRFDDAFLIVNLLERDAASWIEAPADAPRGFARRGLLDPRPPRAAADTLTKGLY